MNSLGAFVLSTEDGKAKYDQTMLNVLSDKQVLARSDTPDTLQARRPHGAVLRLPQQPGTCAANRFTIHSALFQ